MDDTFLREERRIEHRTALRGFLSVGDVLSYLLAAFGQIVFDILLVSWTESLESLESKFFLIFLTDLTWTDCAMNDEFIHYQEGQTTCHGESQIVLKSKKKTWYYRIMCFSNNRILCLFWSQHGLIFQKCNNGNEDRNDLENKSCHPLQSPRPQKKISS